MSKEPGVDTFMKQKYRDMINLFKKPWKEEDDNDICDIIGLYINEECHDFDIKIQHMVGFKTFCNTQVSLYFCADILKLNYQL